MWYGMCFEFSKLLTSFNKYLWTLLKILCIYFLFKWCQNGCCQHANSATEHTLLTRLIFMTALHFYGSSFLFVIFGFLSKKNSVRQTSVSGTAASATHSRTWRTYISCRAQFRARASRGTGKHIQVCMRYIFFFLSGCSVIYRLNFLYWV